MTDLTESGRLGSSRTVPEANALLSTLTYALILFPVGFGIAVLAALASFFGHFYRTSMNAVASVLAFIAALLSLAGFGIALAMYLYAKHHSNGRAGVSPGTSLWLAVVAAALLFAASFALVGGACCNGRRERTTRKRASMYDKLFTTPQHKNEPENIGLTSVQVPEEHYPAEHYARSPDSVPKMVAYGRKDGDMSMTSLADSTQPYGTMPVHGGADDTYAEGSILHAYGSTTDLHEPTAYGANGVRHADSFEDAHENLAGSYAGSHVGHAYAPPTSTGHTMYQDASAGSSAMSHAVSQPPSRTNTGAMQPYVSQGRSDASQYTQPYATQGRGDSTRSTTATTAGLAGVGVNTMHAPEQQRRAPFDAAALVPHVHPTAETAPGATARGAPGAEKQAPLPLYEEVQPAGATSAYPSEKSNRHY